MTTAAVKAARRERSGMDSKGLCQALRSPATDAPLGSSRRSASLGFSLIDVIVAVTLITVALGGMLAVMFSNMRLARVNEQTAIAMDALTQMAQQLRAEDFGTIFANYNANANDDPGGVGTAPGPNFAVPGLDLQQGDADGFVGRIAFPAPPAGAPADSLREDSTDAAFGMPRNLGEPAGIDALDHATDYSLLPVRIQIDFRGASGPQTRRMDLLLVQ